MPSAAFEFLRHALIRSALALAKVSHCIEDVTPTIYKLGQDQNDISTMKQKLQGQTEKLIKLWFQTDGRTDGISILLAFLKGVVDSNDFHEKKSKLKII